MKLPENLFDVTREQADMSKSMYGSVVKCLVAPYHNFNELEKAIPYSKETFLFPEREMTAEQCRSLLFILSQKVGYEYRIITTNLNIICDMYDGCVRVLTESGKILPVPCKTFAANIHTIRYDILENKAFKDGKSAGEDVKPFFNIQWDTEFAKLVEEGTTITKAEHAQLKKSIGLIGERVIAAKLSEMLAAKKIVG